METTSLVTCSDPSQEVRGPKRLGSLHPVPESCFRLSYLGLVGGDEFNPQVKLLAGNPQQNNGCLFGFPLNHVETTQHAEITQN